MDDAGCTCPLSSCPASASLSTLPHVGLFSSIKMAVVAGHATSQAGDMATKGAYQSTRVSMRAWGSLMNRSSKTAKAKSQVGFHRSGGMLCRCAFVRCRASNERLLQGREISVYLRASDQLHLNASAKRRAMALPLRVRLQEGSARRLRGGARANVAANPDKRMVILQSHEIVRSRYCQRVVALSLFLTCR